MALHGIWEVHSRTVRTLTRHERHGRENCPFNCQLADVAPNKTSRQATLLARANKVAGEEPLALRLEGLPDSQTHQTPRLPTLPSPSSPFPPPPKTQFSWDPGQLVMVDLETTWVERSPGTGRLMCLASRVVMDQS